MCRLFVAATVTGMAVVIEPTIIFARIRKLPITEAVTKCFHVIIEEREKPKVEKVVDWYTGFLFLEDKGLPLVACIGNIGLTIWWSGTIISIGWRYQISHRMYVGTLTVQIWRNREWIPRHYKASWHSDISDTMNLYTHFWFDDAE